MSTTPRSEPRPDCTFCAGRGLVIKSRDPDEDVDCVCTDPPVLTVAERVDAFAAQLGIDLMPWQRDWAVMALSGEEIPTVVGRRAGWTTVKRIVEGVRDV